MSITDTKNIDYEVQNNDEVLNVLGRILDSVNDDDQELKVCAYLHVLYLLCLYQ